MTASNYRNQLDGITTKTTDTPCNMNEKFSAVQALYTRIGHTVSNNNMKDKLVKITEEYLMCLTLANIKVQVACKASVDYKCLMNKMQTILLSYH